MSNTESPTDCFVENKATGAKTVCGPVLSQLLTKLRISSWLLKGYAHFLDTKPESRDTDELDRKLARLRAQLLEPAPGAGASAGTGFDVSKSGDARIALVGFPS